MAGPTHLIIVALTSCAGGQPDVNLADDLGGCLLGRACPIDRKDQETTAVRGQDKQPATDQPNRCDVRPSHLATTSAVSDGESGGTEMHHPSQ